MNAGGLLADMPTRDLARSIRKRAAVMTSRANAAHIGSSFSVVDILAVLYSKIMLYDPENPAWPGRDRFILSKGHGCAALYAVLAEAGFFPLEWLDTYYLDGSHLAGHATHKGVPGIEASTGSLGHGFPLATGMALVAKREAKKHRVFAVISDGECDEGPTWEAALFAPFHGLDNLVLIVDYNKIQSLGRVEDVLDLDPLAEKWQAFGWATEEVDGHDVDVLERVLGGAPLSEGRPTCVVAHTVKGKGVSFMEDKLQWHYSAPKGDQLTQALAELEQT